MKIKGSVIFVAGGVEGFGYHLVVELLLQGAKVIVVDKSGKEEIINK